jgi:hypothetical protein
MAAQGNKADVLLGSQHGYGIARRNRASGVLGPRGAEGVGMRMALGAQARES